MSSRIDVSIEHRNVPEPPGKHPNTCPQCASHYRDDELEAALWVCPHCGHHFTMRARSRIATLADEGTFVEEAADRIGSETDVTVTNVLQTPNGQLLFATLASETPDADGEPGGAER